MHCIHCRLDDTKVQAEHEKRLRLQVGEKEIMTEPNSGPTRHFQADIDRGMAPLSFGECTFASTKVACSCNTGHVPCFQSRTRHPVLPGSDSDDQFYSTRGGRGGIYLCLWQEEVAIHSSCGIPRCIPSKRPCWSKCIE